LKLQLSSVSENSSIQNEQKQPDHASEPLKVVPNKPFRKTFTVPNKDAIRWFPGHMSKGLKQMQQKLKTVDCIIEVFIGFIS
jgi:hypothetical protein